MIMRLLLVEDDPLISRPLIKRLQNEQFAVDLAEDGETGLQMAGENDYAVVMVDWELPRLDGLSLLKRLRALGRATRVLFLTCRADVADRIAALQAGADDYLVKPFAYEEVVARMYSLLRRPEELIDNLKVADLELDRISHTVTRAGKPIMLSQREYGVLEYLMRNAGYAVSRNSVVEHVWNLNFEGLTNIVDVYVNYLRMKIDRGFSEPLIHTARGIGYMLAARAGTSCEPIHSATTP
jgi:DNA-binding response OmpR family regulator